MFEHLKKLITTHDLEGLFSFCSNLADKERLALLDQLQHSPWGVKDHKRYDKVLVTPNGARYEYLLAIFLLTRSLSEYEKQPISTFIKKMYCPTAGELFSNSKTSYILSKLLQEEKYRFILDLYHSLKPDEKEFISFDTYWILYKAGEISFDEALFMEKITATYLYEDKKVRYTDLVLHDQEFHDKIFRRLHRYENQMSNDAKLWEEFFVQLQEQGYVFDRKYISELLESLLNPWKKPQLNWHCRWVEFLEPTTDELLACQQTLFALLSIGNTNLINFAMKLIKQIADEKSFDFPAFADNFALCFATQKIAKSQLIGLNILEKHYKKQAPTNPDYREQLAVLFTVPDAKLQEKVASLLTTYFNHEGLSEVFTPYRDYLKGKAQELLSSESPDSSESTDPSYSNQSDSLPKEIACAARTPRTWDDLLFLLGDCIRERSPLALDLFFEGLNQLQVQIPADFSKQISPYQKQLGEQPFEFTTYRKCMRWVIDVWEGKASLSDDIFGRKLYNPTPFLREKTKRLLLKLKQGNTLPFVSTPTHAPFYIDPLTFLERIVQYEKAGKSPMWEDVVVGLNRLLPTEITEVHKQLTLSLTGEYALALQYYFEVSKTITITDTTRVLWGQVLRLKDIDGLFPELEIPQKPNLQGLVCPFYLKYEVKPTEINGVERNKIILEDNWDKKYSTYSLYNDLGANYYNVSPMSKGKDEDIDYQLSLNPRYIDGWLCKYLLTYAQGVEGESLTEATRVMSLLLQYNLPIYHGGWLMVATCLLAERKNLRDLATEYILLSLQKGETLTYLAEVIGTLLAHKYTPINRFMEFLNIPTRDPKIKAFQKAVVEAYLPLAEQLDKKPTNHKKLADWRM